ncbi:MAG: thiolase domain-containing protein [Candidatus Krumholzibacteria bacterium]|nr:thiolase domain-containing protein [Candidatus Krumholzibacteria bacterium]
MIEFKTGNLRVPKWTRPVYMVAAGTTDYRKRYPAKKLEELCMMAFRMLLEENDLKMDPLEVKGLINFACYGEFADHFQDQLLCEAKVHDYLGLDLLPNVGIKTGGATGGSAMLMGATTVASGMADCALVLGWERMDEVKTWTGNYYISTAACKDFETRLARNYASYYAPMARRFQEMYNVDERVRAEIAVKNRGYACFSPFSQQPGVHTIDEVLEGEIVSDPLRFLECCAMSVGSAAALLCTEELAHQLTDQPARLYVAGGSHTLRTGDRRPMRIPLLPNESEEDYRELYQEMEKTDGRWPGFESFGATRFAAYMAYRMAGIKDPLEDLDLVETHDAFTISDLQTYGDVGLTLYGREQDYVTSGECYHENPHTGQPGKCPSNLSGGLLGTTHAVGATGIFQAGEVLWQLQNNYDKFHGDPRIWERYGKKKPPDWKSLQVKDPRRGLAISHAGVGSHVVCTILEKAF